MHKKILNLISKYVSDEQAESELTKLVNQLKYERDQYKTYLSLLEGSIRSDYDSILITSLELEKPGPKIVYVNDGFTKMTGYTREEAIGNTPRMLQGEKTDRIVLDKLKKRLQDGQAFFGHTVNYRKDGTEFINQWDIHPLTNKEGEITHWVSYQHDITERKRSERKVVDAEIEFDKLAEESKKTLIDVDEQGNIVTSNKSFRDLIGFDDGELKKMKFWNLLSEKEVESFRHRFDAFKPSDFDGISYDLTLTNKKDNLIEVEALARLLSSNGHKIVRIAFQNKSLKKRIMSILNQRNKDFSRVFDQTTDFTYKVVQDSEGEFHFDYVSDTFSTITGVDVGEVSALNLSDFIHREDIEKVVTHFNVVLEGKPNTEQFRVKGKTGEYIEVIDYAKPDWDDSESKVNAIKGATSTELSSESKS
ncbi:MAG: PAS domain S-box protein [Balneolaceae bacterium]